MGVQFNDLIPKEEISFNYLKNKTVAIDSLNIIYQFLSSIRLQDGTPLRNSKGEITSPYNGIFYKTVYMLERDITPIWVFDGKPSDLKQKTQKNRKKAKEEASTNYINAKLNNNIEDMKKYAKRVNYLEKDTIKNCKELLSLMGIPYIEAISEGEGQCAYMVKKGDAFCVVSQDYDALLYGATNTVRNMTSTNKPMELVEINKVLNSLNISLDDLINIAILIGTDYNIGGVKGIGPKKALKIVKEKKIEQYIKHIENYEEIYNIFKNPKIKKYSKNEIKLKKPNIEKLEKFLIDRFDFSHNRIMPTIKKLDNILNKKRSQTSLDNWF